MKNLRYVICIIVVIFTSLFFLTSTSLSKSITIGEAEMLYSEDVMPITYDSSLSTIQKDANTMYFFHSGGCRYKPGAKRKSTHSWYYGPPTDPLKVHVSTKTEEELWDYNGYYRDRDQHGIWILGIHKLDNGDLLAITHSESDYPSKKWVLHFAIGIGYSTDGGENWTFCGEIAKPADDRTNCGGGAYIIVNDYLYVYFNDTKDINGAFTPDKAERSNRIQCVARAKLDDVLKDAANHKVGKWFKYKDGQWDTPALSNISGTDLIPKVYGQEDVHSDAAYCTALDKYLLTVESPNVHKLLLFSSPDGVNWKQEAIVDQTDDNIMQPYSSFVEYNGSAADCSQVGSSFYIYYPHVSLSSCRRDYMYRRLVTVK